MTDGFYKDEADIANSPESTFGEVKPGDLKYVDQNGDGVIDDKDEVYLGEVWGSPFTLGLNFTVKWKNFTLFAAGSGYFGAAAMNTTGYTVTASTPKWCVDAGHRKRHRQPPIRA